MKSSNLHFTGIQSDKDLRTKCGHMCTNEGMLVTITLERTQSHEQLFMFYSYKTKVPQSAKF